MAKRSASVNPKVRVARHRAKATAQGARRIEVTVPARDAWAIKAVAGILRAGGKNAEKARKAITSVTPARSARTGAELVEFFRSSPFVGEDIVIERDRSTGRRVALE